jgi:hypothetical protein
MYVLRKGAAGFLKMLVTQCFITTKKTTFSEKLSMKSEGNDLSMLLCTDRKC